MSRADRARAVATALCLSLCAACGYIGIDLLPVPVDMRDAGPDGAAAVGGGGPSGSGGGGEGSAASGGAGGAHATGGSGGGSNDAGPSDAGAAGDGQVVDPCAVDRDGDADSYVSDDSCGVGYCRATNTPSACVDGVEVACKPGAPLSTSDATCDGVDDNCDGSSDENYSAVATCGIGYCRSHNTPSSCVSGVETACAAGAPLSGNDATCDGVDDNCNGTNDENYVPVSSCGIGYCRSSNTPSSCVSGSVVSCQPGAPLAATDATADGVDDDCDGNVDEDVCVTHTQTYGVGSHALAFGTCRTVTITLWGGGGAAGDAEAGYWANTVGGNGGAGGYAKSVISVTATQNLQLLVGQGGQGCGTPGASANDTYQGGAGATARAQNGSNGANGAMIGGAGGKPSSGGDGGNGYHGGGGGGAGSGPTYAPFGGGGGGGAATVLLLNGAPAVLAGGGGGGGGAGTSIATNGYSGGAGGPGCSGTGVVETAQAGGGGGGGRCMGDTTSAGTGRTPYNPDNNLQANAAVGGSNASDCTPGGDGFAIVTFAP